MDRKLLNGEPRDHLTSHDPTLEICWQTCFQVARQSEYHDIKMKLLLMGFAIDLCPADHVLTVLSDWRNLKKAHQALLVKGEDLEHNNQALRLSRASMTSHLPDLRHVSEGLASMALNRMRPSLPFTSGRGSNEHKEESLAQTVNVTHQARHVISKGLGWLIGGDEQAE